MQNQWNARHVFLAASILLNVSFVPTLMAAERVIFFDDFNTTESYHEELTPNATNEV